VAGGVRHLATRRLRRKTNQLERRQAVERERARIAKDIHDDLGANLTLIAVLGDLAKKEKTGERVEKISSTAREAVNSLDEIVWAVNPRNDTLAHLVDYTGQFAINYQRDAGDRSLRISVEDDGCGFDRVPVAPEPAGDGDGGPGDAGADGLRNTGQRLAEVGGEFRIQSRVGAGATITVELPLPPG